MSNKNIGINIIANIAGKVCTFLAIYLFVPFWIKFLGIEGYGVINFYTILLTLFIFADAGLTATLTREFARSDILDKNYKQNLLRTFEYIYAIICILIVGGIYIFSPQIVHTFLKTQTIPYENLITYVRLMGGIIALYLLFSLYTGGLMGLQHQVKSNVLNMLYSLTRSGLVLIPLYFFPTLDIFLWWQLLSILLFCLIIKSELWKIVSTDTKPVVSFDYINKIKLYALGMMAMAFITSINSQIDKLSVSNILSLKAFSYYSVAATVGQAALILTMPIGLALSPELTRLISIKDKDNTKKIYHEFSFILTCITTICSLIIICYSYDYILIWTHNQEIASSVYKTTNILVIGNFFLSVQLCPYFLALANGHTKTNVTLGITAIPILLIMLSLLIPKLGLMGAALPFLFINIIVFFILGYVILQKYLIGEFKKWILHDTCIPIIINSVICIPLYFFFRMFPGGYFTILYGIIMFCISFLISSILFFKLNPLYQQHKFIKKLFAKYSFLQ